MQRTRAQPISSEVELIADLLPDLRRWAELWEVPGLEQRAQIRFSRRLEVSLGRCTPARASIRLHCDLARGPRDLLLEVVCHELAHVAAWEMHGRAIRPHGREWQDLVSRAGYVPSTGLQPPKGCISKPKRRRRRRRRYLYEHRCPSCDWRKMARAAVRRWRCPECIAVGREGELEIWRIGRS